MLKGKTLTFATHVALWGLAASLELEQTRRRGSTKKEDSPADTNYFNKTVYQDKDRATKMDELWSMCVPDQTIVESPMDLLWSAWGNLLFAEETDMADSFRPGDEMPD